MKRTFLSHFFMIAMITLLFSFTYKKTAPEFQQQLAISQYSLTLTNPTGWYLNMWTYSASPTNRITIRFIADVYEPGGKILYNVNFQFNNVPLVLNYAPFLYSEIIPLSQSGYPTGTTISSPRNVAAYVYTSSF